MPQTWSMSWGNTWGVSWGQSAAGAEQALTGQASTGASGTVLLENALLLPWQSSDVLHGTIDNAITTALLTAFITSELGTITAGVPSTIELTGQSMTGSMGTLSLGLGGPGPSVPGETQFIRKKQRLGPLVRQRLRRF